MDDGHSATFGSVSLAAGLLAVAAILLSVPLNLAEGVIPTPFLPLIVIFLYGLDRPASLPPALTFGMGLFHDLLFGAALGPWASVYLIVHAAIIWQRSYFAGRDIIVLTTGFAIAMTAALLAFWFEMSILSSRPLPVLPMIGQALVTILVFPPLLFIFRRTIGKQRVSLGA